MRYLVKATAKAFLMKPDSPGRAEAFKLSKDQIFIEQERTDPERGFVDFLVFVRPGKRVATNYYKILIPKTQVQQMETDE